MVDLPGPTFLNSGDVELEKAVEPFPELLSVGGAIVRILSVATRRLLAGRLLTAIHPCCGGVLLLLSMYVRCRRSRGETAERRRAGRVGEVAMSSRLQQKNRAGRNCLGNSVDVRRLGARSHLESGSRIRVPSRPINRAWGH